MAFSDTMLFFVSEAEALSAKASVETNVNVFMATFAAST
jgi:hypothetical protein